MVRVVVHPGTLDYPGVGVVPPRVNIVLPGRAVLPRQPHMWVAQKSLHAAAHVTGAH